jgi:GT2 family glycosyltransferase
MVSIVLVTWNSARWLTSCLEGIRSQTVPVELIAVDNASGDASAEIVAPFAAHLLRNGSNRGFSAAVNQALPLATHDHVLLLNPDCRLAPDYIEQLTAALAEAGPRCGSATGMLVRATGEEIAPTTRVDSLGIRMTRSGRHLDLGQDEPVEAAARKRPFEVFGVSGAAALLRRTFVDDVTACGEVLDEDFFAYREDADLAWRGRLFGWKAICDPRAVAYHVRRVTPSVRRDLPAEINLHSVKNRFLLRMKNEGMFLALRNAPFELARDVLVIGAALSIERDSLPAFAWLWRNRARIAAKRREIQARRVVSDRDLARWFQ